MTTPKQPPNKKLKRSDVTDEMRRKFHVCDHDKVGYSEITRLALAMLKRSKQDAENIRKISEVLTWQKQHIENLKKTNEMMVDKYEDTLEAQEKQLEDCHKDKNDITRAYNGLHSLGKFAEEQGLDIKKASRDLPENQKNKYDFKQKHSLLESGKVTHEYFFGKKKNGKDKT